MRTSRFLNALGVLIATSRRKVPLDLAYYPGLAEPGLLREGSGSARLRIRPIEYAAVRPLALSGTAVAMPGQDIRTTVYQNVGRPSMASTRPSAYTPFETPER